MVFWSEAPPRWVFGNNLQLNLDDQGTFGDAPGGNNQVGELAMSYRVRGIGATVARNYFGWGLPVDTYNIERLEDSRGPSSVLFGLGSAGGVINASTKQARLKQNFYATSFAVGSYDSWRISFGVQTKGARQNFIFNNLFVGSRNGYLLRSYRQVAEPQIVENNCFWNGPPGQEVVYMTNAGYTVRGADEKFDEWARNLQRDPLFVDARRDNFRLQAESPCARSGKNIAALMGPGFVDFDGRPWDPRNPSIGAFQFTAGGNALAAAPRTD